MLRVRRRAFTLNGTPIEASDNRYLASKANFSVTTARGQRVTDLAAGWGGRAVEKCEDFWGGGGYELNW